MIIAKLECAGMTVGIAQLLMSHHAELLLFWNAMEGICVSEADEIGPFSRYLKRNPRTNFVAVADEGIVGSILASHDGRRGWIRHLAVAQAYRSVGLGTKLTEQALQALHREGIDKSYLFLVPDNKVGETFWKRLGWRDYDEFKLMTSYYRGSNTML